VPVFGRPLASRSCAPFCSFFKSQVQVLVEPSANGILVPLLSRYAITSENVTSTAFALPYGLSVMRTFNVPGVVDELDDEESEGAVGDPPQPKIARLTVTAIADLQSMATLPPAAR
jgi:hypothetical protein